jgi:uncharacterized protein YecT (DUF1311 family)
MFGAKVGAQAYRLVVLAVIAGAIACGGNPSEEATSPASTATAESTPVTAASDNDSESTPSVETTPDPVAAAANTTPNSPPAPLPAECSNPTNQATMNRCAQAEYAQVDAELNQRYQAVRSNLSADQQDRLVTAGRAWIEFRDANCEFVQMQFEGGSIQPMVYLGCLTQLSQDRIDELAGVSPAFSYKAADQQLNQVYQEIQAVLPEPEQEQLTTAQLAWLEYRDLQCAVDGSSNACLALLTEFRTGQLQNQLEARSR